MLAQSLAKRTYPASFASLLLTKFKNMYAIVEIAGQQFKVTKDQYVYVHRLDAAEGAALSFDSVLLIEEDGGQISIGAPTVSGASVSATVLSHVRGDKVLIFKKKRRKGYRLHQGHRQDFTKIQINNILA
jgi:large subunit ribosomal protein L21